MSLTDVLLLAIAGLAAGAINAAVGSGSLITYPALLSLGIPPVIANGTNCLGVVPGAIAGAWAYRDRLDGMWREEKGRIIAVAFGAVVGALLVVVLPSEVFDVVVPWLILSACVVVAIQPLIVRALKPQRRSARVANTTIGGIGIYGGYFGAGQGIGYLAALTLLDGDDVQQANGGKNVLAAASNGAAAAVFALAGMVLWLPALVICCGSLVGGFIGGSLAKKLPVWALRAVVVIVGLYAVLISFRSLFG